MANNGKPVRRPGLSERTGAFWQHKTVEEIAAEQGKGPVTNLDDLACPELWNSDEEFWKFIDDIYERRRQGQGT